MAIFSKRSLQEMLYQNGKFLTEDQLKEHVNKLNGSNKNPLAVEWEVIILNTFSKIGYVQYERKMGKGTPDLFFQSKDESNISFLADITTVSDAGYETDSPVKAFIDATKQILKKNGIKLNAFHYEIGGAKEKRSMRLKIPANSQIPSFFKSPDFKGFIARIKENPCSQQNISLASESVEIRFYYNPQGKYFSGTHPSYNTAHSLTNNTIYNALKSKAQQLKKSDYDGTRAIFLCDGGCNLLTSTLHDWQSYSLDKIVNDFFCHYSSIHFILTFAIRETPYNSLDTRRGKFIEIKLFPHPTFVLSNELSAILNKFVAFLPTPVNTVVNAANKVRSGFEKQGNSF